MRNKKMLTLIKNFPKYFLDGYDLCDSSLDFMPSEIENIVYAGMGGSAIAGDAIKEIIYPYSKYPFEVVRNYDLPSYVSDKTFLLISSFSGNTEETLNCLNEGIRRNAKIITISANGMVEKISIEKKVKHIKLPLDVPPRAAMGMTLGLLLKKFSKFVDEQKFQENVQDTILKLTDYNFDIENAKRIAKLIKGKVVNIYIDSSFSSVGKRFANQLHENSKHFAHFNFIPEMNHNEIVGLENPDFISKKMVLFFIIFKGTNERNRKRIYLTKDILDKNRFETFIFEFDSDNDIFNIVDSIITFDLVSYFLALENGEDPMKIKRIDILKKRMKK